MRVLLVEDEERDAQDARVILREVDDQVEVTHVRSRDSAFGEITATAEFDLIVCDIRIPPKDGGLDADEQHGLAVHARARRVLPGVPQLFLTGFATPRNIRDQLGRGGVAPCFGREDWVMVQLAIKDTPDELRSYMRDVVAGVTAQSGRLTISGAPSSTGMVAAIRCCADRVGATRAEVFGASGLSNAEVARVIYRNSDDQVVGSHYLKVEGHERALREQHAFDLYVPTMLSPGLFAPLVPPIVTGLRGKACLISTVADPQSMNIFAALTSDADLTSQAMDQVFQGIRPWTERKARVETTIGDFRRALIPDEEVVAWGVVLDSDFEATVVDFSTCVIHGDLHAENILIDSRGRPVMIDFGDTGIGPGVRDPLTLELSLFLHQNGIARAIDWPGTEHLRNWMDVDAYVDGCPWPAFVQRCRTEAQARGSDAEVAAFAYAHALRHLKWPDRQPELVASLVTGIIDWFARS